MAGFDVEGKSTALEVRDTRFEEDVIVGVRMRVSYDVADTTDGVVITHRLDATLPGGPLGRLVAALLRWRLRRMQQTSLRWLAAQAEADDSR